MKKLLLVGILGAITNSIMAIEPIQFGVMAGMNVANITLPDSDENFDSRIGFSAGLVAKANLQGETGVFFQSGVLLSLKGAESKERIDDLIAKLTFNSYYLDIPIHVGYSYAITNGFDLFASFGPTFSVGMFGKVKAEVKENNYSIKNEEDVFGDDALKRFDMGLGGKIGCELNDKFQISLSYDWGIIDITEDSSAKNRNFQIGVAYLF